MAIVAAAPLRPWASTSARIASAVMSGTSPLSTSTGTPAGSSPQAAATAPPVPSWTGCTTWATPSGSCAARLPSGEPTTTIVAAPASRAAWIGQWTMGRPQIGCRTFGTLDRIRVPWPAAMMTTLKLTAGMVRGRRAAAPGPAAGLGHQAPLRHVDQSWGDRI